MMGHMSGKASKRERRRLEVEHARDVWEDRDFGLRLDQQASGRGVFRWTMDLDPALSLLSVERVRAFVDQAEEEFVLALRAGGESWADIASLTGMTGERARQKFGPAEREYLASTGGDE